MLVLITMIVGLLNIQTTNGQEQTPLPTQFQLNWQKTETNAFIHFTGTQPAVNKGDGYFNYLEA